MAEKVLVTGGAGFIGSFIVDLLVEKGHEVTVFDNLEPQVHGRNASPPAYLNKNARFVHGSIMDKDAFARALEGQDVLFHEAALVGVGQSMYEIDRYTDVNASGAARVLQAVIERKPPLRKMLVASSMSIYGEGQYECAKDGVVYPRLRSREQLSAHKWEIRCPKCGGEAKPVGTAEEKPLFPTSIYAVNKRDHEEMFLAVGHAYSIPTVALRYFNVYGPRQALSNPYTGAAAIFSGRLLNRKPPVIFEDGSQTRDFIHVTDIARANVMCMEQDAANYEVFNVGTGRPLSILQVAQKLSDFLTNGAVKPEVVEQFREGDIRHCYGDISKIRGKLGYEPKVRFEDGIAELVEWVRTQTVEDTFDAARKELEARGLTKN
jgi:dTDP-L-rhamnose 4-epimerase